MNKKCNHLVIIVLLAFIGTGCLAKEQSVQSKVSELPSNTTTPFSKALTLTKEKRFDDAEQVLLVEIKDDLMAKIDYLSQDKQELMNLYYFVEVNKNIPSNIDTALNFLTQLKPISNLVSQDEINKLTKEYGSKVKYQDTTKIENGGILIGMTKDEVLQSKWGSPRSINKTTSANKVSEQWVYAGNKYLYFEDGKLVTIQN
ncbi:hypothetical protein [Paenibacillus sp. LjRoot56]|uniref:hypothetical protein n=1 Tax=Paenibacillus sp. LjRoot56 TaxID=3342333 RepID=UPI003ECC6E66